ncbi:MAG: ATP-binding protein, partial [Actinomycetota bacterium]
MNPQADASRLHLRRRLAVVEARVSAAVARRRAGDPDPDDRFRGLYISDSYIDHLLSGASSSPGSQPPNPEIETFLARVEAEADEAQARGADLRLRRLTRCFGLDDCDLELLLIALAPDLDLRFERLYSYLNDDVSRRRASTGLALDLCGAAYGEVVSRSRFNASGPLVGGGLLLVEEPERPFLTRSLRVPDRVASNLLGDDTPDPLVGSLVTSWVKADLGDLGLLVGAIASGIRLSYIRERTGAAGQTLAATALTEAGFPPLVIDLSRLDPAENPREVAASAVREARMRGAGLVLGPVDAIAERGAGAMRAFAEGGAPVVLIGSRAWDPGWSREVPLLVEAPVLSIEERNRIWSSALDGAAPSIQTPHSPLLMGGQRTAVGFDPASATAQFLLGPDQVVRA